MNEKGLEAMLMAIKVSHDIYFENSIKYLMSNEQLIQDTNIIFKEGKPFAHQLFEYVQEKIDLFLPLGKPQERNTRDPLFSMEDAYKASQNYIKLLLSAIRKKSSFNRLFSVPMCLF